MRGQLRRRLIRAEMVAGTNASTHPPCPQAASEETLVLAGELAAEFGQKVEDYRKYFGLTPEEARTQATEDPSEDLARILNGPPEKVSWSDLDSIARSDPEQALRRWEEIKAAARRETRTGQRAARALEVVRGTAWERARFLAVRAELSDAIGPRSALEQHLVDQLAQWQTLLWNWQQALVVFTNVAQGRPVNPSGAQESLRLSDAEAQEHAARMVERVHRQYQRTLRALQELRRRPAVVVRHARQVNLAAHQVNVSP